MQILSIQFFSIQISHFTQCSILAISAQLLEGRTMCIRDYLQSRHVWFETLLHRPAPSASSWPRSFHVSGRYVAKGVLVKTGGGDTSWRSCRRRTDRPGEAGAGPGDGRELRIATEDEVKRIFGDCERGALPPFGRLYGLTTVVDASLSGGSRDRLRGELPTRGRADALPRLRGARDADSGPIRVGIEPRRRRNSHRRAG